MFEVGRGLDRRTGHHPNTVPEENAVQHHPIAFIAGLHRSGTSLVHQILRDHPDVSGFRNTGVPKDEGQHLQTVYPPARSFGGPGRFGFDPGSYLDETSPLCTPAHAERLWREWSPHWDLSRPVLIEKSPPSLLRTRYFQRLFPASRFIVIVRNPIVVAMATRKVEQDVSDRADRSLDRLPSEIRIGQRSPGTSACRPLRGSGEPNRGHDRGNMQVSRSAPAPDNGAG
jgi:hypothetical protein